MVEDTFLGDFGRLARSDTTLLRSEGEKRSARKTEREIEREIEEEGGNKRGKRMWGRVVEEVARTTGALTRSSLEGARLGPWTGSQLRHRSRSP